MLMGEAIPDHGVYPGLGDRFDQDPSERIALHFPKLSVERITRKIVRGLTFIEGGQFILPPLTIDVFVLDMDGASPLREALDRFGKEHVRGPGITVRRAVADDSQSAVFEIEFFQQFKTHAVVLVNEPADEVSTNDVKLPPT